MRDLSEYHKKRNETRYNQGICQWCSNDRVVDRNSCVECLKKRAEMRKLHYKKANSLKKCYVCGQPARAGRKNCEECGLKANAKRVQIDLESKRTVMVSYGNQCACCKNKNLIFLSIDHINNDGNAHRALIKKTCGGPFYRWLIKNNFPKGFQILCHNCHAAKTHEGSCTYH